MGAYRRGCKYACCRVCAESSHERERGDRKHDSIASLAFYRFLRVRFSDCSGCRFCRSDFAEDEVCAADERGGILSLAIIGRRGDGEDVFGLAVEFALEGYGGVGVSVGARSERWIREFGVDDCAGLFTATAADAPGVRLGRNATREGDEGGECVLYVTGGDGHTPADVRVADRGDDAGPCGFGLFGVRAELGRRWLGGVAGCEEYGEARSKDGDTGEVEWTDSAVKGRHLLGTFRNDWSCRWKIARERAFLLQSFRWIVDLSIG